MSKLSLFSSFKKRNNYLSVEIGEDLTSLSQLLVDREKSVHCENLIGAISLPLGVAGPVIIPNKERKVKAYLPLATTEGALVASVNRGCKAINLSCQAEIFISKKGTTRGPVFKFRSISRAKKFVNWLEENEDILRKEAEKESHHLRYLGKKIKLVANYVFVRFSFDTGKAMGMNMVTIAMARMVRVIERKTKIKCLSLAGNFDVDKKPAWLNFIDGRGYSINASVTLSKEVVEKVLKTTPTKVYKVWLAKSLIGSAASGSIGFNGHFANIVAAFFAATGQDLAHTVEGSLGLTIADVLTNGNLYFAVHLPAIMLGVIGGGTNLISQRLGIKISGAGNSEDLARRLGMAVLAGELSLTASLAEGSLADSHQRLGR